MYTPRHFAMPDDRLRRALAQARVGHLVTVHSDGPAATLLPIAFVPQPDALGSFPLDPNARILARSGQFTVTVG